MRAIRARFLILFRPRLYARVTALREIGESHSTTALQTDIWSCDGLERANEHDFGYDG